jgi:hypothetical protein
MPEHNRIAVSGSSPSTAASPGTLAMRNAGIPLPDSAGWLGSVDGWLETDSSISNMSAFDAPFHSFWFPEHGTLSNQQIDYMVTQFKSSIKSFVLDNQTPFIHLFLYQGHGPMSTKTRWACAAYIFSRRLEIARPSFARWIAK